jgi:glycosyltransferase involved in cell wall biosynthesis
MRILIVNNTKIPVTYYGGTERVIWSLGKELVKLGHEVIYLVNKDSFCDFAPVKFIDYDQPIINQIPVDVDVIHFNFRPPHLDQLKTPYIITLHGNLNHAEELDRNTVFVSKNHAQRFGSKSYVYNGLDWDEYTQPDFTIKRKYFHFIGNAAWRVKNVKGAIKVIQQTPSERLKVLGGVRFNFNMGMRFTFSPRISFVSQTGGKEKNKYINQSKGLIFPVRWHEPFGLAIIESLYYGCPVFGTPYGSLQELIPKEVGHLSATQKELTDAVLNIDAYSRKKCHEYALDEFNSKKMAMNYLSKYEQVLNGKALNDSLPSLLHIQHEKFLPWG